MNFIVSHHQRAQEVLREILAESEGVRFFDADVHFLDEKAFREVVRLERWLDGECVGERQRRRFGFKTLAKLVNREAPADRCILYRRRLYKHVVDEERVRELARGHFEAWKNARMLRAREEFRREGTPPEVAERKMRELAEEIGRAGERLSEALEREERMILTEFENSRLYPAASLRFGPGRFRVEHLSIRLPNLVRKDGDFELRVQKEGEKPTRRDAFVRSVLRRAERIAGGIYVLPAEEVSGTDGRRT